MTRYAGRKAVVIGGTRGTGLAIAKRLVEGGAEVLLTGRTLENLRDAIAELGSGAHVVSSDLADLTAVKALAPTVEDKLGHIDFLFVNAGISLLTSIEQVTEEEYDRQFTVNTKGIYFTVQALLPLLHAGGSIVFTISVVGTTGTPGTCVHSMTKSALWSFAQALASELVGRDIRVNAVAPGLIDTAGCSVQDPSHEDHTGFRTLVETATPMRRHGSADEVARAALFLAADATFTTGTKLAVDGGLAQYVATPQQ
ncbi:SDR family NAD(P)-dependent oxidoreductase [Streptomyces sp. NBC_01727]|uniref:SDR family NAD(P)-dependent oxidoreductase n=1 Tax=Streptomyces sp. NBC_01727 TaxID=2975924 RepID=UPI002E0FF366|nr:SDR family oxidoreductase [Streptomyces sp. NBC_01727]